jgi:cell division protein FtsB
MSYSIQQLEMRLHALTDRIGKLEHENQVLKRRVAELEKQQQPLDCRGVNAY